ncbi:MAG: hypothetical protein GY937_02270 [bacterium]|nr:hypothetical protein [bacterium]
MKIAMVTTFYPPYHFGGDAIFIRRLTHALAIAQGLLWRSGLMALGLIGGVVAMFVPKPTESGDPDGASRPGRSAD